VFKHRVMKILLYGGVEVKLQHSQLQHRMMTSFQLEAPTREILYYRTEFWDSKIQYIKLTGHCIINQEINKLTRTQQFALFPLQNSSSSNVAIDDTGLILMASTLITNSHFFQRYLRTTCFSRFRKYK
jgi:hypothetical protein